MKAIVQDTYGSPDVLNLREIDTPEVGDDEALVRVHAAGVDRGVWHLITGLTYLARLAFGLLAPKTSIPGMDLAGVVEAAGKNVCRFEPGDEVFGIGKGTFAEYALAREEKLAPKPANLTFEQAAVLAISGLTALQSLRDHGRVETEQRVLVITGGETDGRWLGGTERQLRALVLSPFVGQKLGTFISTENHEAMIVLKELIEDGKVTPVIDRTYPLAEVPEAICYLEEGHAQGKVVITV